MALFIKPNRPISGRSGETDGGAPHLNEAGGKYTRKELPSVWPALVNDALKLRLFIYLLQMILPKVQQ